MNSITRLASPLFAACAITFGTGCVFAVGNGGGSDAIQFVAPDHYAVQAQTETDLTIRYFPAKISQTEVQTKADEQAGKTGKKAVFVNTLRIGECGGREVVDSNFHLEPK